MQETWVQSLVWEDPTCSREAKPMYGNYWACSLELGAETSEPMCHSSWTSTPTAHGLQQERLLQWEVCAPQLEGSPCLLQPEKSPCSSKDPGQQKSKWMKMKKKKKMWTVYHGGGVCVSDVEMLCSESLSQNWCRKHKMLQHQPKMLQLHTQQRCGQGCQSLDFPRLLVANDWVRGWLSSRPTPTPWREILPKDHFGLEKFIGLTKTFSKFQRGLRLFLFNCSIPLSFHRYQIWSKALLIYSSFLLL